MLLLGRGGKRLVGCRRGGWRRHYRRWSWWSVWSGSRLDSPWPREDNGRVVGFTTGLTSSYSRNTDFRCFPARSTSCSIASTLKQVLLSLRCFIASNKLKVAFWSSTLISKLSFLHTMILFYNHYHKVHRKSELANLDKDVFNYTIWSGDRMVY